jgi:hypothetical protein
MTTSTCTVSDNIGAAVRDARTHHGWKRSDLAARCASLGAPQLTSAVIYDIETGRRDASGKRRREVSVGEWLTLALALDVAPVHLAVPLEDGDRLQLTSKITEEAGVLRVWMRGRHALKGTDRRIYYSYVPQSELRRAEELAQLIEVRDIVQQITEREEEDS